MKSTTRSARGHSLRRAATLGMAAAPLPPMLPSTLRDWLTQLTLLYGVPFDYLVADPRLLPPESMRFFHLDQNWLRRAVDGALSTATLSTAERVFNEALYEAVYAEIEAHQQSLRAGLRRKDPPPEVILPAAYTGLLFRSVVVSGWPGLEVLASRGGEPVQLLRMDRLSDSILLVLFAEQPDSVSFIEPSEGLHFGLLAVADGDGAWQVNLRGLGFGGYDAGAQITIGQESLTGPVILRAGKDQAAGVVDVASTVAALEKAMPSGALGPDGRLGAAGFALQMVRGAGRQDYTASATALCPANGASGRKD